jgi:hypothetical protein
VATCREEFTVSSKRSKYYGPCCPKRVFFKSLGDFIRRPHVAFPSKFNYSLLIFKQKPCGKVT